LNKRLNIGLFIDDIDAVFTSEAVKGAELGAIAIDANMYIFPGMYLDGSDISEEHSHYEYQYNTLFQFVSEKHIDVLYVMMGMIGCRVSEEERITFLKRYLGIPIVTLYTRIEGYQSIIFDNQTAFTKEITHLIQDHGCRKIGYVSGPKTNVDAMERLSAYVNALEQANIPYNDDYVIYGNFEESSEGIIGAFVAEHPELDAVAFANDRMALGGYRAFEKMGINIGTDLKVVSFDNSSFAPSLAPPLTTIEANAAELSYKAIINAETFIRTGKIDNLKVDTHLIKRSSCGCLGFNYSHIYDRLNISEAVKTKNLPELTNIIHNYLFGEYMAGAPLVHIKDDLSVFIQILCDMTTPYRWDTLVKDSSVMFIQVISQPLFQYTSAELFADVLMTLQYEIRRLIHDTDKQIMLLELFSSFFRELAIKNYQVIRKQQEGMERTSHIISNMTIDMFHMDAGDRIPFEKALDNLSPIGMQTAYLYTYLKPVHHSRENIFEKPEKLLFRAYYDGSEAIAIPEDCQEIASDDIFVNDKTPDDRRVTMVLSPLFSNEDLYGILMSEIHYEYFRNIAPVTIQISIALKSLLLLEQQHRIQLQLQENLEEVSENNIVLSEISKTDQLTGLYNRWGFMEQIKNIISAPRNYGKEILVLYADMDHLKMINDEYGHDEGDFALKEIASILKEAFRSTDIVARFGGDEFVVFAMTGIPDYENIMKRRITEITERHNREVNKPYIIEMSTGICEVTCDPEINISLVLETADKKLYIEKKAKKACRQIYMSSI
jgi:diguanylate cyclase (GGDEF)-like protein